MKTKDFKIGKIQEFLYAMRARKEGVFLQTANLFCLLIHF